MIPSRTLYAELLHNSSHGPVVLVQVNEIWQTRSCTLGNITDDVKAIFRDGGMSANCQSSRRRLLTLSLLGTYWPL